MYSENPSDPAKRIEEFKNLVAAIHAHGMGVILDVVYNHTAKTAILKTLSQITITLWMLMALLVQVLEAVV